MSTIEISPSTQHNLNRLLAAILVAGLVGITAWLGIELTRGEGRVSAIWIANGLLAGLVVTTDRSHWPLLFGSGFIGNVGANLFVGDPPLFAVLLALCNQLEVLLGCTVFRALRPLDPLSWQYHAKFLLGCAIAGPLLSALPVSFILAQLHGTSSADEMGIWLPAHMLGMATFTPLVVNLRTSDYDAMLGKGAILRSAIVFATVGFLTAAVFSQPSYPLLFYTVGPLVLAAFQIGRAGLSVAICIVLAISLTATLHGIGPFTLLESGLSAQIFALQSYILSLILMTFPVAITVELMGRLRQEIIDANAALQEISMTDALTGLPNRRAFDAALEREWRIAQRNRTTLSLLILDIDHFKKYNDTYGHSAGDDCLARIGSIMMKVVFRPSDMVARIGGEEFGVILPATHEKGVMEVAERFREQVYKDNLPAEYSEWARVTVSIGIGTAAPTGPTPVKALFDMADANLYRAKKCGRNRVEGPGVEAAGDAGLLAEGQALLKEADKAKAAKVERAA